MGGRPEPLEVERELLALEAAFLSALSAGSEMTAVNDRLGRLLATVLADDQAGTLTAPLRETARHIATSIKVLVAGSLQHARETQNIHDDFVGKCRGLITHCAATEGLYRDTYVQASKPRRRTKPSLSSHCSPSSSPAPASVIVEHAQLASRHDPYRAFILARFTHPYPTPKEKAHLLTQVPGDKIGQLNNWMMNQRKRSGYSALRDKYAYGCQEGMERLKERVENGTAGEDEAREYRKVWTWFEAQGKVAISDKVLEGAAAAEQLVVPDNVRKVSPTSNSSLLVTPKSNRVSTSSSSIISYASDSSPTGSPYSVASSPPTSSPLSSSPCSYYSPLPLSSDVFSSSSPPAASYLAPLSFPLQPVSARVPGPDLSHTFSAPLPFPFEFSAAAQVAAPPLPILPLPPAQAAIADFDFLTLPPRSSSPSPPSTSALPLDPHPFFETLSDNPFTFAMPQTLWPLDAASGEGEGGGAWSWDWDTTLFGEPADGAGPSDGEKRSSWSL